MLQKLLDSPQADSVLALIRVLDLEPKWSIHLDSCYFRDKALMANVVPIPSQNAMNSRLKKLIRIFFLVGLNLQYLLASSITFRLGFSSRFDSNKQGIYRFFEWNIGYIQVTVPAEITLSGV